MLSAAKNQLDDSEKCEILVVELKKAIVNYVAESSQQEFSKDFSYNLELLKKCKIHKQRIKDLEEIDAMFAKHKKANDLAEELFEYLLVIQTGFQCFSCCKKSKLRDKINAVLRIYSPELFVKASLPLGADEKSHINIQEKENLIQKKPEASQQLVDLFEQEKAKNNQLQSSLDAALAKIKRLEAFMTKKAVTRQLAQAKNGLVEQGNLDANAKPAAVDHPAMQVARMTG